MKVTNFMIPFLEKASILKDELDKQTGKKQEYTVVCSAVGIPPPKITFSDRLQKPIKKMPTFDNTDGKVVATLKLKTNHSTLLCEAKNRHGSDVVTIGLTDDLPVWMPKNMRPMDFQGATCT